MASTRDWAEGYLQQARADLRALVAMGPESPSTFAMLSQMVLEKFAKAALLRQGAVGLRQATSSHKAASRLLHVLRRQRQLFRRLGGPEVWEDVLSLVVNLELAHPALAPGNAPRLEYPWEDLRGSIQWPALHLELAGDLGDPRRGLKPRLLHFVRLLDREFDAMFP